MYGEMLGLAWAACPRPAAVPISMDIGMYCEIW